MLPLTRVFSANKCDKKKVFPNSLKEQGTYLFAALVFGIITLVTCLSQGTEDSAANLSSHNSSRAIFTRAGERMRSPNRTAVVAVFCLMLTGMVIAIVGSVIREIEFTALGLSAVVFSTWVFFHSRWPAKGEHKVEL